MLKKHEVKETYKNAEKKKTKAIVISVILAMLFLARASTIMFLALAGYQAYSKFVVTEHITGTSGDMVIGNFYGFPFPPCLTGPDTIGFSTTYLSMLIDMADFDNDGDFDFLVMKSYISGANNEIWFLLYTNQGVPSPPTFTQSIVASVTTGLPTNLWELTLGLTVADFNGDGKVDFATNIPRAGEYLNEIWFYRNLGGSPATFTFQTFIVTSWAANSRDMDTGDFDRDGDFDFVIFDYPHGSDGNFKLYWYENTNPTAWSFTPHPIGTTPHSVNMIVAADFGAPPGPRTPRDGWIDFIVGQDDDGDPGQVWLYINNLPTRFIGPFEVYDLQPTIEGGSEMPGSGYADALDCDGDGDFDVVATGQTIFGDPLAITLYCITGNGAGGFSSPVVVQANVGSGVAAPPTWYYPYVAKVGGVWLPIDKFGLLAPYFGLASMIIAATVVTFIYIKRTKHKNI